MTESADSILLRILKSIKCVHYSTYYSYGRHSGDHTHLLVTSRIGRLSWQQIYLADPNIDTISNNESITGFTIENRLLVTVYQL
ncbi:hypothetical protein CEXT_275571 [Caerostris extrusa]|uniref:Uncharacterized protein n=1 Tax=Caerostris extrusa TaxID=172846 RepID=A0AAV4PI01_CAEEX|nr:hypothetical protein CEXT_275571 [Caerostris extrusa]